MNGTEQNVYEQAAKQIRDQYNSSLSYSSEGSPDAIEDRGPENIRLAREEEKSSGISPDQAAKNKKLATEYDIPETIVAPDPKRIENEIDIQKYKALSKKNPVMSEFFQDYDFSKLANDDVENLSFLEKKINEFKAGYNVSDYNVQNRMLYQNRIYEELFGTPSEDTKRSIEEFEKGLKELDPGELGVVGNIGEQVPLLRGAITEGAKYGAGAAATGVALDAIPGGQFAWGSLALSGFLAGSFKYIYEVESANAYQEFRNIKDQAGNSINEKAAAIGAMSYGLISAALENVSLAAAAPLVKPLYNATKGLVLKEGIKRALGTSAIREVLTNVAGKYALAVGTEATTEMLQETSQILIGEAIKNVEEEKGEGYFEDVKLGEAVARVLKAGKAAAEVALVFGGATAAASSTLQVHDAIKANRLVKAQKTISKAVNETKLKDRAPSEMKKYLSALGVNQKVQWTPEGVLELFQQDQERTTKMIDKMGLDPEEVLEKARNGQDTEINMADVYVNLTDEEQADFIQGARVDNNSLSVNDLNATSSDTVGRMASLYQEKVQYWKNTREELKRVQNEVAKSQGRKVATDYGKVLSRLSEVLDEKGGSALTLLQNLDVRYRDTFEGAPSSKKGGLVAKAKAVFAPEDFQTILSKADLEGKTGAQIAEELKGNKKISDLVIQSGLEDWLKTQETVRQEDLVDFVQEGGVTERTEVTPEGTTVTVEEPGPEEATIKPTEREGEVVAPIVQGAPVVGESESSVQELWDAINEPAKSKKDLTYTEKKKGDTITVTPKSDLDKTMATYKSALRRAVDQDINSIKIEDPDVLPQMRDFIHGIDKKAKVEREGDQVSVELTKKVKRSLSKSAKALKQGKLQPKGSYFFDPATNKRVINLFRNADPSTLIHETAHLFLDETKRLIDSGITGTEELKADFDKITEAFKDEKTWEDKQEAFAQSFEQYFIEDKAPTQDLIGIFHRFKRWLMDVYTQASVPVREISSDIKQVFDRMFTTELDTLRAAQENEIDIWTRDEMRAMGVSKEDEFYMRKLLARGREEAADNLRRARTRSFRNHVKQWRSEATRLVNDDPARVLATQLSDSDVGINYDEIVAQFGEDTAQELNRKRLPKKIVSKEGMGLNDALALSNYSDVGEMIRALRGVLPEKEAIRNIINQRRAKNDLSFSPEDFLATSKSYNDFVNLRQRYVNQASGRPAGRVSQRIMRQRAQEYLDKQPVRDATNPRKYVNNFSRYSKLERSALQKKDYSAASEANNKAKMNYIMSSLAAANKEEIGKLERLSKRISKKDPATLKPEYRRILYDLISRYLLANPNKIKGDLDPVKMSDYRVLEGSEEDGRAPFPIDSSVLYAPRNTNYKTAKMSDMRDLRSLLKYLEFHGKTDAEQLLANGEKVADISKTMTQDSKGLKIKKQYEEGTVKAKLSDIKDTYYSYFNSFLFVMKALGGFKSEKKKETLSYTERNTTLRLSDAEARSSKLTKKYLSQIEPHYNQILDSIRAMKKKYGNYISENVPPTPEIFKRTNITQTDVWTPTQIFSLAFQLGNESNRSRIFSGFKGFTQDHLNQLMDFLSTEDMDAVQGIWDVFDQIFSETNEVHRRMNKFSVKKIPNTEFRFKGKTYRGGYAPVRYDARMALEGGTTDQEKVARFYEDVDLMSRYESRYGAAAVRNSSLSERVVSTQYPLNLSLDFIGDHLADSIHYISFAEPIRDVRRLLTTQDMKDTIVNKLGSKVYQDTTYDALKYIANPRKVTTDPQLEGVMGRVRGMTTAYMLAYNLNVAKKQLLSAPAVILRIGFKDWAKAYGSAMYNCTQPWKLKAMYQDMLQKSDYMNERQNNISQDFRKQIKLLNSKKKYVQVKDGVPFVGGKKLTWDDVVAVGFLPIRAVDAATVTPLWNAAYQQSLKTRTPRESVIYADDVIRSTQPSSLPMDLTKVQRASATSLLAMFGTFTIGKQQQRIRMDWAQFRSGTISFPRFAQAIFLDSLLPAALIATLNYYSWGKDEQDELKDAIKAVSVDTAVAIATAPLPVIGSMFNPFSPFPFALSSAETLGKRVMDRAAKIRGDVTAEEYGDLAKDTLWLMAELFSMYSRIPVTKIIKKIKPEKE